ncbi:MAG: YIP1 family protein [Ignavibacteriales bacterium]|nr:YIP1 family protein [Ignavibacteriales bacterium]
MENQDTAAAPQTSVSLGNRITNILASPSEAFDGVKDQHSKNTHWVIPYLLFILLAVLFTYLLFVNEPLKNQIFDMQSKAFDEQVQKGQITQQQADRIREQIEGTGIGLFMLFGTVPQIVFISLYYFGAALFLWLTSKVLWKSSAKYGKYLEIYGLASWVGVLGYIVTILMILGLENMFTTPSLGLLLMGEYDPLNTGHKFLSAMNLFSVWQAAVTGIGLSKIAGKSVGTGIGVAIGLWIIWVCIGVPAGIVR